MYTYYRTSFHSTNIQRILQGSISGQGSQDLILIKDHSLEWLTVNSITEKDTTILKSQCQQPTLGTIIDARLLTCHFEEDEQAENISKPASYVEKPYNRICYAKNIRNHSRINGNDVVVALSEYGRLVFLTIIDNESLERPRFEALSEVYLDTPGLEYDKKGRRLAVDPSGRAIAVASFENSFDIFILGKRMSRTHFDPIMGRGSEWEEGIIWHMEFLYTEEPSMNRILLVLVVYNDVEAVCRLVLYAIDASDADNITVEKISRLPLEKNTPSPLLFIPLNFQPESFLLITEQEGCLLIADDLSCGNVLYPTTMIPRTFGEFRCALFTAFALHPDSRENYLYLGGADGSLYRVEIEGSGEIRWRRIHDVNPIGQSMSVIGTMRIAEQNGDEYDADVLFYAAESADNELIAISREAPNVLKRFNLQTLDNFAPLTDMNVVREQDHDTLILCSGQGTHGSLRLLTHGVEAIKLQTLNADWKGIYCAWSSCLKTSLFALKKTYILLSSLIYTRLLAFDNGDLSDITMGSDILSDAQTIYAAFYSMNKHDVLLQIHSSGWSLVDLCCAATQMQWKVNGRILSATTWQDAHSIYVSLCIADQTAFSLKFIEVCTVDDFENDKSLSVDEYCNISLNACPSCINQFLISTQRLLVVGTFAPSLMVFSINEKRVNQIQYINLKEHSKDSFFVPNSLAMVETSPNGSPYLLAGLRQGFVLSFQVNWSDQEIAAIKFMQHSRHRIGSRSVHLTPCLRDSSSMYILSDDFWKLSCNEDGKLSIDRVLLSKSYGTIDALIPLSWKSSDTYPLSGETVGLITENQLKIFQLSSSSALNTTKMELAETPKRVIYDKLLNYIVAITTTTSESNARENYINLLDPFTGQPLTKKHLISTGNRNENISNSILSAAEWLIENNGKLYTYLCVGLGHTKPSLHSFKTKVTKNSIDRGTLLVFRLKLKKKPTKAAASGNYLMRRVWSQELLEGGVYSLCPYAAGLLCSSGKCLHLYRLDLEKGSLYEVALKALPYIITSIYEDNGRICVTSHKGSIAFYHYDAEANRLKMLKSDVVPRSIHHSLMITDRLALGVSQSGGVIGLYDNPNEQLHERRLQTLFCFHYPDILVRPTLAALRSTKDIQNNLKSLQRHIISWSKPLGDDEEEGQDDTELYKEKKVSVKPVVCGTVSGGLVHIYRISPLLFEALKELQSRLLRYKRTEPLLGGTAIDFENWYSHLSGEESSSVHGDVVESFLRLSRSEQLEVLQDDPLIAERLRKAFENLIFENDNCHNNMDTSDILRFIRDILLSLEKFV